MKKSRLIIFFLLLTSIILKINAQPLTSYVNPFIGTNEMGHTYPGASVPFGMVQLSPETDTIPYSIGKGYIKDVYRYCAGYQYTDSTIVGFSHTHFSGTGHSDLGDFLLMPTTGQIKTNPGIASQQGSGYRSRFSHTTEKASPGFYEVMLSDYGIHAELTATARVGVHRYTYPDGAKANLIIDMESGIYNYDGKVIWSSIRVENDTLVTGYRQTRGWARERLLYFAMSFSKPMKEYGCRNSEKPLYNDFYRKFDVSHQFPEMAGQKLKAWFSFGEKPDEPLVVKMALSAVSTEGALRNLQAEASGKSFDDIRTAAENAWNRELSKISIEADQNTKTIFYTALYHTMLSPTLYMDVDGQYRGLDHNIHNAEGFENYTTFSLWDTYRALHPLFTIIDQKRTVDMINSMLAHREQSVHHILPVWSHHANENWCMIGYHAASVIADAWMKRIRGFDGNKALKACVASSTYALYDGIGDYMKFGFVPTDKSSNSASKTLEYAYDDYAISRFAADLGEKDIAAKYLERSRSFEKVFDTSTGFMHARNSDGSFLSSFDPLSTERQGFIEGNAWNYSLYVPQDPQRLISLMGGTKRFTGHLDSLFTMELDDKHFAESEDISRAGMIGNYVHGNEPSHHVPYLYVFAGKAYKTQERVRQIMNTMYRNATDGLCGNDDCGQMSAWYVLSALGFYPVCPASNEYIIGLPSIEKAVVQLENGKQFTVKATNLNDKNRYVRKILLNGKPLTGFMIRHEDIMNGSELEFVMGNKPVK